MVEKSVQPKRCQFHVSGKQSGSYFEDGALVIYPAAYHLYRRQPQTLVSLQLLWYLRGLIKILVARFALMFLIN